MVESVCNSVVFTPVTGPFVLTEFCLRSGVRIASGQFLECPNSSYAACMWFCWLILKHNKALLNIVFHGLCVRVVGARVPEEEHGDSSSLTF